MRHLMPWLCSLLLFSPAASAQESTQKPVEVYTSISIDDVETVSGEWPSFASGGWFGLDEDPFSHVIMNPPSEGFFALPEDPQAGRPAPRIVVRSIDGAEVTATLVLSGRAHWDTGPGKAVRIRIPKERIGKATREDFLRAAQTRFRALTGSGLPGGAWFRHRLAAIEAELGTKPKEDQPRRPVNVFGRPGAGDGALEETYDFFSAGRAVSENLRLERTLAPIDGGEPSVAVETIQGIDTKAFDWTAAIAKLSPRKDPLAAIIPEDQHAAFFMNLRSFEATVDALETKAAPIFLAATDRSEDAGLRALYETQLGFRLHDVARDPVISAFVKSVAVTGSDPYFPTGTDVAILLEAAEPKVAYTALELRHRALSTVRPGSSLTRGDVRGTPYSWLRSDDRAVCSLIAQVGPAVVVTNSVAQLERLVEASQGAAPSLAASPEYVFFRDRYAIGSDDETGFVLLTDATIRRWCGPRWRIGDARRMRAAAQLANLTVENKDAIVRGHIKPGPYAGASTPPGLEPLSWTAEGIRSGVWGDLRFLTPIVELDVSRVTKAEADAYSRFRAAYQSRWAAFFDPIAIRLSLLPNTIGLDVTVMPVVASSEYRELMDLARSVRFGPTACDPHDTSVLHFTFAVDATAAAMADFERGVRRMSARPEALALSWLKGGVSIALDRDPILEKLDSRTSFDVLPRLPLILSAEVKDPVALALLLTGIRAGVEDMGLGTVRWIKGKHRDVETMTLSGIPFPMSEKEQFSIRYTIVDGLLIVTLREDLLHQAIDRAVDRRAGKVAESRPWLGESAALRVDKAFVDLVARESRDSWDESQRELALRALPILQEWHRIFPDQDPVAVHEKLFKIRLVDPAGGRYLVNEDGLRIVSETYGHLAEPKPGPDRPKLLEGLKEVRAGLTFENDGVRARFVIEKDGK